MSKPISDESFQKRLGIILSHSTANFIQVRLDHIRFLKGDGSAAALLGYLINMVRMKNANAQDLRNLKKNKLWFRCLVRVMRKHLGMGEDRLRGALDKLIGTKVIEETKRAKRATWIRIKAKGLRQLEKAARQGKTMSRENPATKPSDGKTPRHKSRENPATQNTKNPLGKKHCRPEADGVTPSGGFGVSINCSGNDHRCATYLHQALVKHRKIMRRVSIPAWSKEFLLLSQTVGWSRIKQVLDWYCLNIGRKYVSACYSAKTFCEKFPNLEDAMGRDKVDKEENTYVGW